MDGRRRYLMVFFAWALLAETTAHAKPIRIEGVVRMGETQLEVSPSATEKSGCGAPTAVPTMGAPVGGVLVFIDGQKRRGRHLPATRERLTFAGCALTPRVIVVGVGSSVRFENDDPLVHSVVLEDERARVLDRISLVGRSQISPWVRLRRSGRYVARCAVDEHASSLPAGILALPDSLFARTDENGRFEITGVPAGRVDIVAWDPALGEGKASVRVGRDGLSAPLELVLTKPMVPRKP